MSIHSWAPIESFDSIYDYKSFIEWMDIQINSGFAKEHNVDTPYHSIFSLTERWVLHIKSDTIWRIVAPDGPFHGLFEPVNESA